MVLHLHAIYTCVADVFYRNIRYRVLSSRPPDQRAPYSMVTTAPRSLRVATIFSASSLGTDSFIVLGALSTNFFESTKLKPSNPLTSLIILGLAEASKDMSLSVNRVFSAAAGAASSCSAAAGAATGAAAAAAANPPTGRSGMFSRDFDKGC